MVAPFDRSWQVRLLQGEADAALQLAEAALPRLCRYCRRYRADEDARLQVVRRTLVRAVREIRSYDPDDAAGEISRWLFRLANAVLRESGTAVGDSDTELGDDDSDSPEAVPVDDHFVYRLQADMCLEALRHRDEAGASRLRERDSGLGRVSVTCPKCGRAYQVRASRLGQPTRCGSCHSTFRPQSSIGFDPESDEAGHSCWYLQTPQGVGGPYSAVELREKVSRGEIGPEASVRRGEDGSWRPVLQAEGLFLPSSSSASPAPSELPPTITAMPIEPEPPPVAVPPPAVREEHAHKISRFEIHQKLGSGAFGDVYRAYDPVLDRELALKVATAAALDDAKKRPYVLREGKAAAKLRHPHIVAVHDAGFDGNLFYIAIDLIHGHTLQEILRSGSLDRPRAIQLIISIAEALDYAHEMGVLHRDVKPGNIMVDVAGQALLMDFGLAYFESRTSESFGTEASYLGTPGYMPPEQIRREFGEVGPRSDQYSLGVVLYELLCGQPPYTGNPLGLLHQTTHAEPPEPRSIDPSIPLDLQAICLKSLAKRLEDRYATCGQMADDLKRFVEGRATIARPLGPLERVLCWCVREPALSLALGVCGLLLLTLTITLAIFAVNQAARVEKEEELRRDAEEARRVAEAGEIEAERNQRLAEKNQRLAERNQGLAYFRGGHTLCGSGQTQRGMVYLARGLMLAEHAEDGFLAETIRYALFAWRRELHVLEEMEITAGAEPPDRVLVHPEGRWAVTISRSRDAKAGDVRIWDLKKTPPEPARQLDCVESIEDAALGPGGEFLATVGRDADGHSMVRLWQKPWENSQGRVVHEDWARQCTAMAFSPDATRLAVAGVEDGRATVVELDLKRGGTPIEYRFVAESPVTCMGWSEDGKLLAVGAGDEKTKEGRIVVCDARTTSVVWSENRLELPVNKLAFSHDGQLLAAALGKSLDGEVRMWKARDGEPESPRLSHLGLNVHAVAFSPDNRFILTAGQDRSVRLWDRDSGVLSGHAMYHTREVRDIAFVPGSSLRLLSVSDDGFLRRWRLAPGIHVDSARIAARLFAGVGVPSTPQIAIAAMDGAEPDDPSPFAVLFLKADEILRKADTIQPVRDSRIRLDGPACAIAINSAGSGIVGMQDGRILRLERRVPVEEWTTEDSGPILSTAVSADDRFAAAGGGNGTAWVWEASTGRKSLKHGDNVTIYAVAFDPKTSAVLTAGNDGLVRFWDRSTGSALGPFLRHPDAVLCAAYGEENAAGSTLAIGFAGGAKIWRRAHGVEEWTEHAYLQAETGITCVHVWPECNLVATGDLSGNLRFWHARTGEPIGPVLSHQQANKAVPVTLLAPLGGQRVLSGTSAGHVRRSLLPELLRQDAETLQLWVEVMTGMKLNEHQVVVRMEAEEWRLKKKTLASLPDVP